MEQLGEIVPSTHDAIWIATALLHKESKERDVFTVLEIFNKTKELDVIRISDSSIKQHISSHCVANTWSSPDTHRYLYRVDTGKYRLYKPGDGYLKSREDGKTIPVAETIPHKYRELLEWYNNDYCKRKMPFQETAPSIVSPPYVRIDEGNKIEIPKKILERLFLRVGDYVCFIETPDRRVQIQKMRIKLQPQ